MKLIRWIRAHLLLISSFIGTRIIGYLLTPPFAHVCARIGLWSYPLTMGVYMTASFCTLLYLASPEEKQNFVSRRLRAGFISLQHRLKGGFLGWLLRKSPFICMLAVTLLLDPMCGALVPRVVGLNERTTWRYVFITNLIAALLMGTFYIGLGNAISALFE